MKTNVPHILLSGILALGAAGFLFAQGQTGSSHHPTYDMAKPPPISLLDAYVLAATHLGEATNRVHCVNATCLNKDSNRSSGWTFEFSNTHGHHAVVKVFFSNKDVWTDPATSNALK